MCGLVGLINKKRAGFYSYQRDVFCTLLYLDYLRGQDSTGIMLIENSGDVQIAKEASDPIKFMSNKAVEKLMTDAISKGSALIGHNRKATRGTVNDENAHPFVVDDNIVLVHNGSMNGDHKKHADVEVDSHAIAHVIHKKGDPTEALSSIDAAFALIWYDFGKMQINMIRNSERPLWWMETDDEWIYASEPCMLNFVRQRHALKVKEGPLELTVHNLQQFSLKDKTWEATYEKLDIKKPWSRPTGTQMVWPRRGPHANRYNNGYYFDDDYSAKFEDVPFELGPTHPLDRTPAPAPAPTMPTIKAEPTHVYNRTTQVFERALAKRTNKIVPRGQFYGPMLHQYPADKVIHAIAFDYVYANQKDDTGGFYLYLTPYDDMDVICRVYMENKYNTEERMVQIAGTSWVYKLTIAQKWWGNLDNMEVKDFQDNTPGYAILKCERPEVVYGGGMGDENWYEKLNKVTH